MNKLLIGLAMSTIFATSPLLATSTVVAVIDTGVDRASIDNLCKTGHRAFTATPNDDALVDNIGHGTHIAGIIQQNAKNADYCIMSVKFMNSLNEGSDSLTNLQRALRHAINLKVDLINISGGGLNPEPDERSLIEEALNKGIKVVAAAGNEESNLSTSCNFYPACYDSRIVVVGNMIDHFNRSPKSNFGTYIKRWEIGTDVVSYLPGGKKGMMSGTSQATAVATGKLIRESTK